MRQERIKRGWKQSYVSERIGLTQTAIHDIETGERRPSFNVLLKLCKLFEIEHGEIEQFFSEPDNNNPQS